MTVRMDLWEGQIYMGRMPEKFAAASSEYKGKIRTFARKSYYLIPGFTIEDMEQELRIVLWDSVFNYREGRGAIFNTFFQHNVKNRIATLIRQARTQKRTCEIVSLDDDELRAAIEESFVAVESAEDTVVRRTILREYTISVGPKEMVQLVREHDVDWLLGEDINVRRHEAC